MDSKEFTQSYFTDKALSLSSLLGTDKSTLSDMLELETFQVSIDLPKFMALTFTESYDTKEKQDLVLKRILEECLINEFIKSPKMLFAAVELFIRTRS